MGRNIRKYSFLAMMILCLLLSTNISAQEQNWELEINLSKQTYLIHEPIWLDVTLTNISEDTLRTNGIVAPYHFDFIIELKDSLGNVLDYTGLQYLFGASPGELFESGEFEYECFDLLRLFEIYDSFSGYPVQRQYFPFLPPGNYSVKAIFENVTSNELFFEIIEPVGEEKEVLEQIVVASKLWKKKDTDPSGKKYQEIADNYPFSIYAEKCLRRANSYSDNAIYNFFKYGSPFDRKGLWKELLVKYPNSGSSRGWLKSMIKEMSEDEKEKIIDKAIKDHPNTRASKYARQMLKNIKKKRGE